MSADDDFTLPSWFPRFDLPRDTPSIEDQLKCPPGTHRELGRGCVPDEAPTRLGGLTEVFDPLPPVDETPNKAPCPPGTVRSPFGDCRDVPRVIDPSTGAPRPCSTDDECENPELFRKCPPGLFWNGSRCALPWTPNPFIRASEITSAVLHRIAAAVLGDLGAPAPKRAPGPSRRPSRRRRPAPRKRPPARPNRPAPAPRMPPRVVPGNLPMSPTNPVQFILREFELYTRPLGERRQNPRRGGARTRARFPPLPPVVMPTVPPLEVEIPRPAQRSRSNAPTPAPAPAPARSATPAPSPRVVSRSIPSPLSNPLLGLGLGLLSSPLFSPPAPRARTSLNRQPSARRVEIRDPIRDPIGDPFTPLQPQPRQQQQIGRLTVAEPTNDPCAVRARDARRRQRQRRKECKRFVTKTVRVCADK